MWRWPKRAATLDDINEWLRGFGEMLQSIDAKLEEIVDVLRGENDEGD